MSPRDKERAKKLRHSVKHYQSKEGTLRGLATTRHLDTLVEQFIDSLRRVEFAHYIRDGRHDPARMDPTSDMFDPLRAAVLRYRRGEYDEAWWLVFLGTHFGKHAVDGWRLTRDVYGRLGQGGAWDWATISRDPSMFRTWLAANEATLRGADGVSRRFSNHRKYESLKASSKKGVSAVIESYVRWVAPHGTHSNIVRELHKSVGQDPNVLFAALYKSMDSVQRFGRLGKFDFLAMLGKLGIAPVDPGSTFLKGATGPLAGARQLYTGDPKAKITAKILEAKLIEFGKETGLGAQVLEDALCNWQKSPDKYIRFKG
ncbi:alpha-glutamyl/putrescinyl thymine pyrophosphorylase clade 3 protein [Azospirillum argentinense]